MALTSRIYARIETEQSITAFPATARSQQTVAMSFALLDGLGAGKADVHFVDARQIAILGNDDIDLNGVLQDVFGRTINAAQVKAVLIGAEPTNAGNIVLGGAGGTFAGPFGGTNPSVNIPPGGFVMFADRGDGWSSAAGSSDILRVSNASSAIAKYQIMVVAASALLPVPSNITLPAISGVAQVGQVLSVSNGTWTDSPTGYAYQWNKAGVAISGALASSYTPVSGDIGAVITCTVTATNGFGSTPATSNGVTISASYSPSADFSDARNSGYIGAIAA